MGENPDVITGDAPTKRDWWRVCASHTHTHTHTHNNTLYVDIIYFDAIINTK